MASTPTFDPNAGNLPDASVPKSLPSEGDEQLEIVQALQGYKQEAKEARASGPNPRDKIWNRNINLYWNRYDFSGKADWQAKHVMPEVPSYVDRFAAALKEALVATPNGFYTVEDPMDENGSIADNIKRMTDAFLDRSGTNPTGAPLSFPAVFEEQMKLGAQMACAAVVTWKNDVPGGRVAIETVDPRTVWLDHTYRNLYRLRQIELDKHDLLKMAKMTDAAGKPIFNVDEIQRLVLGKTIQTMQAVEQASMSGNTPQITSNRQPIIIDEYVATIVGRDGSILADNAYIVVADDQYLLRGPETKPFWHGKDWLVYSPMISAPLSPYGRSYMEDFGSVAQVFTELTNLILDAVYLSSINATVVVPEMLQDPAQLANGLHANMLLKLEGGFKAGDFAETLTLGQLSNEAVSLWDKIKNELTEAANVNEIGLGQFAPNSRTSATEISATQQSSSALVRSVAQTVESRFLEPVLDLTWKTGLQFSQASNQDLARVVGRDMWPVLMGQKKTLIKWPYTFQARGISTMIQKSQMLNSLLQILQVISQNQILVQTFMQKVDPQKLIDLLFTLSNVDKTKFEMSALQQRIQEIAPGTLPGQTPSPAGGQASPQAEGQMQDVAQRLNIQRGG